MQSPGPKKRVRDDPFRVALSQAEARLGFAFPPSLREVASLAGVETSGWRLWPPQEWTRVSAELAGWDYGGPRGSFDHNGYAGPDGVVIGGDDGGNVVCLLVEAGSSALGQPVFRWDHTTAELTQLAACVSELPELLERRAGRLLAEGAPDSPSYFSRPDLAALDEVCRFCGSGMQGGATCPVCLRTSMEAPEHDRSRNLASKLLARLLQANQLELDRPSELGRLCGELAGLFDEHADVGAAASECCRMLIDDPAVRDLYADDGDVEKLLRSLSASVQQGAV
ncbi:MAG TPA: SMI1/KNR4 family protein [Polyangiaceae bacterium]|nr:SMI1/KNR4 family protein [Polyangiaceae bacterium]